MWTVAPMLLPGRVGRQQMVCLYRLGGPSSTLSALDRRFGWGLEASALPRNGCAHASKRVLRQALKLQAMGPVEAAEGRRYRSSPRPRPAASAGSPSLPRFPGERRQARPGSRLRQLRGRLRNGKNWTFSPFGHRGPGARIVKGDVEAALASGSVSTATLSPLHPEKAPSPLLLAESASNPAQAGNEVTHHTTSGPPPAPFAPASASAGPTPGAIEKSEIATGPSTGSSTAPTASSSWPGRGSSSRSRLGRRYERT
jgi:hypothetical protein